MPTYKYKAIKESGEVFEGSLTAKDKKDLTRKLRNKGGVIVNFHKEGSGFKSFF